MDEAGIKGIQNQGAKKMKSLLYGAGRHVFGGSFNGKLRPYLEPRFVSDHIRVGSYRLNLPKGDPMRMSLYPYEPVETDLVKKYIKSGMSCLDVGANVGYYTLLFASLGARNVYSYEPHPDNFAILQHNIQSNQIKSIELHQSAVSDHNGVTNLYISKGVGQHRITPFVFYNNLIQVPVTTIRQDHIDFAKIDVEGAEVRVLDGMKIMPEKLIIEYNHKNIIDHGSNPKRLFQYLRNHKIQIITKKELLDFDYDYLLKSRMSVNLFCS